MRKVLFGQAHEKDKNILFACISRLLNEEGYETYHLAFNKVEKDIYIELGIKNIIYLPKELNKYYLNNNIKIDFDDVYHYTLKFNELNGFKVNKNKDFNNIYALWSFFESNKSFEKIITWNDTFLYDSLIKKFCEENNIERLVIEDGIFRPNTLTVDNKGVNYNNSLCRSRSFYENIDIDYELYNKYMNEVNYLEDMYFIPIETIKNKKFNKIIDKLLTKVGIRRDLSYINKGVKDYLLNIKLNKNVSNKENFDFNIKYIFIPFQVHDDSQIIEFSDYIKDMHQLVKLINDASIYINDTLNHKIKFVFKEHPADRGRVNYSNLYKLYESNTNLIFLKNTDTEKLIKNSEMVITVNSTVGIEALKNYKKVITLGNAYYNIDGIVYNYNFETQELGEYIEKILCTSIDKEIIDKFLYYLRFNYQIEANWRCGKINKKQFMKKFNERIN